MARITDEFYCFMVRRTMTGMGFIEYLFLYRSVVDRSTTIVAPISLVTFKVVISIIEA